MTTVLMAAGIVLIWQYIFLVFFMTGMDGDHFNSKLHALAWLIPGWPIVELGFVFIRNFWRL